MLSLLLSSKIRVFVAPGFIKLEGPSGYFLKKLGGIQCYLVKEQEELRLFVVGNSNQEESTALSLISRLCVGLVRGYRRRLRLMGIGFRATIRNRSLNSNNKPLAKSQTFFTKTYRRKRRSAQPYIPAPQALTLKIGFSHEFSYPLNISQNIKIQTSRLEGRTKGTLISLQGKDSSVLNQVASEIRAFRNPDAYKGKGIHYDREVIKLKKGKRQG